MKSLKIGLIVGFFALIMLGGLYVSANCSASATRPGCAASCSITAPPGGSSSCTSGPTTASCKAYDINGNLCNATSCSCLSTGATLCAQIFNPSC